MRTRLGCLMLLLVSALAAAEDAKARAAREELERQLTQMVGKQPTRVRIDFIGLDDPNYKIEEASFELDGRSLRSPLLSSLSDDGTHLVWNGDVTPGKHTVKVLVVFSNGASVVLSDEGGHRWKVGGDVTFDVNSGIEVRVQVTPKRDDKQPEVSKRFKLSLPAQPVMIAALDDGKMPEPPPRATIAAEVDAGTSALTPDPAAPKGADASEAKRLADGARKQKAAEALEARRIAAEEKNAKAAESIEARRAAAEAKKAKSAAALEASRAAAAAKKEKAAAALEASRAAAAQKKAALSAAAEAKNRLAQAATDTKNLPRIADPLPMAERDAGLAVASPPVAGAPEVGAAMPVDAGVAAPVAVKPDVDEEGPPWLIIGVAGGIAAILFLVVVARRRARPPTLEE